MTPNNEAQRRDQVCDELVNANRGHQPIPGQVTLTFSDGGKRVSIFPVNGFRQLNVMSTTCIFAEC